MPKIRIETARKDATGIALDLVLVDDLGAILDSFSFGVGLEKLSPTEVRERVIRAGKERLAALQDGDRLVTFLTGKEFDLS